MDKVRFGIVGIGNMGSGHCSSFGKNAIKGAEVTAICDINPAKLEVGKKNLNNPDVACFDDYIKMLDSGLIDVVLIATPHYLHPVIAIEAFNRKINVLSEKPAGVYTKAVAEMIEVAKASGMTYGIMFNQRTNPYYQKMRDMVQSGELGELKRCVWIITDWYRTQSYYNSGGWRATWAGEGGGVLINQCPHNIDLWQWIFGMPCRIRAFCHEGKYHDIEVEDDVTAYAEYANGSTGVFITTTGECPGTNRLEIAGSRGKLVHEKGKLTFTKLNMDERDYCFNSDKGFAKIESEVIDIDCGGGSGPQHQGILQNFTNHLLNGEPLIACGYEGINSLALSNAMMLSSWKDKWVEVPNDGEEFLEELKKRIATSRSKENVTETVANLAGTYGNN